MNQTKLANALRKLGEASYELADALLDSPSAADGRPVAADSPPAAPASSMPEFPPLEPFLEDEVAYQAERREANVDSRISEREYVLGRCPTHDKPWTVKEGGVSKAGKPYGAFWKCSGKDADGSYCNKKPDASWVKTHNPESVLVGA